MPMTDYEHYEGATAGRLLLFDGSKPPTIPAEFVEALGTKAGLMVMVYKDKQIKVYPIQTDDVYFLSVEIGKLTNDFLTRLSQVFRNVGLVDLLFSTGVCLRGTRCFYECYFSPEQIVVSLDELKKSLENLDGVKVVVLHKVT